MIVYRDVHKSFDAPVLAGVNLTVRAGERLSLIGPSGAGKSVLLKITIGLIEPDRGEVLIDGKSVTTAGRGELERLRRQVGYVFQNAALFDSLSVYQNVAQGLSEEALASLPPSEVLERVRRALLEVNLKPAQVLDLLPAELSGGMRKRVGLARAIVGQPQIVLYDEPVTGLDPVNAAAVERLMEQIAQHRGVTAIMVTHDVEGALSLSDRLALLDQGRLRFVGTPEEFRASDDPLVRAFSDRHAAAAAVRRGLEGL